MAVASLNTAYVAIGTIWTGTAPGTASTPAGTLTATDLSGWVTNINAAGSMATNDVTTFGSGGYSAFVAGLKSGTVQFDLLQDFAAAATNALLGLNGTVRSFGSSSLIYVEVKPANAARSATNPSFVCAVLNANWTFMGAKVGDVPTISWSPVVTGAFAELVA
jgi:hypothetical protein